MTFKDGEGWESRMSRGMLFQILGVRLLNDLSANSVETCGCCRKYWLDEHKVC